MKVRVTLYSIMQILSKRESSGFKWHVARDIETKHLFFCKLIANTSPKYGKKLPDSFEVYTSTIERISRYRWEALHNWKATISTRWRKIIFANSSTSIRLYERLVTKLIITVVFCSRSQYASVRNRECISLPVVSRSVLTYSHDLD